MIQLKSISKNFSTKTHTEHVLKNINLEIKQGDFLALSGPSGSGKSTLLNIIGGLIQPTKGKVIIDSQNINNLSDKDLSYLRNQKIGFIFQEFHLNKNLNVIENILLPAHLNNDRTKHKSAIRLLKEIGLSNKQNADIRNLSGGQKQRVAIARALINSPNLILADEPTGNLDKKTGASIIRLLQQIHKTHNTTIIIATHDNQIIKNTEKTIKIVNGNVIN